jgi:hypothetical protein
MIKLTPIKPTTTAAKFRAVEAAVKAAYQQGAKELVEDFGKTYATWDHKPRPVVRVSRAGVDVRIDDEIWGYVDKGTRPHVIRARRAAVLAFTSGYSAKTRPGSIIATSGGPTGDARFAKEVQHPGTKARGFTRRLRAKWKEKWPRLVSQAVAGAVR